MPPSLWRLRPLQYPVSLKDSIADKVRQKAVVIFKLGTAEIGHVKPLLLLPNDGRGQILLEKHPMDEETPDTSIAV